MKKIILNLLFLFVFINLYGITLSSKEKFDAKKNSLYSKSVSALKISADKKSGMFISFFIMPMKFYGSVKIEENGNIIFIIEKMKYITSWAKGWTLGEHEATGVIVFEKTESGYKAKILEEMQLWELTKGEIRYIDDYYRGEKGLQKVKEREMRITELVKFLKENKDLPEFFGRVWFDSFYGKAFNKIIRKFLFDKKTVYPEYLMDLKKSGTITRDLDEAVELFFVWYNFDYYFKNILNTSEFF